MVNIVLIDKFRNARILERVAGTALPGHGGSSGRGRSGRGQYCRALAIFAALACAFVALRSDPAVAQDQCAIDLATANWKSVVLRLAEGNGPATALGSVFYLPESIPDTGVIELSARIAFSRFVLSEATAAIRAGDLTNFAASFSNNDSQGYVQATAQAVGTPFFRYQAEFRNVDGALLHRAVQCSLSNNEIEGFSFINSDDQGHVYMCDWTDGKPESGKAALSPYFEQQPRMNNREAVQTAISLRTPGVNTNLGNSLTDTGDILLKLKPRGDGSELPASVVFSLTDWTGTFSVYRPGSFPRPTCSDEITLPLDQQYLDEASQSLQQYFDRTSESLLNFGEEPPRLTTLAITAAPSTQDHPDTLGQEVEFMITLSPEYSDGAGEGTAVVDLQLNSAANVAFLSGGGLDVSEQDSSRASIRLSTRTTVIRVVVTPDTRSDTTATLSAVANEDGSSLGSLVLTVLAPDNVPTSLVMELRDEQGQKITTPLALDAEGRAEGLLFIQVLSAGSQGLEVDLAGELILELDGLSGQLMQVRVLSDDPSRLPSVAAEGSTFGVEFSAPPNLFTAVTLVAEGYKDLEGSALSLSFERAAETRLVSGNRLSIGTDVLCGLTELGTVRCGGQPELNGSDKASRSGAQGSYGYEVFEVLDGDAESTTRLSGVVALGQSLSSPPVSCALLKDGDVACWGDPEAPFPFAGLTISRQAQRIDGLSNVLQLSMGGGFACALVAGNEGGTEIYCWGVQEGEGAAHSALETIATPRLATQLGSLKGVIQLAAGGTHACALQLDGRVFCWGANGTGQLLLGGGSLAASTEPVEVAVSNVVQIAAGEIFSCALSRSGDKDSVGCWGSNYSKDPLADGLVSRVSPIAGLATVSGARLRQLTIAGRQGCALVDTGELWCWQNNPAIIGGGTESWVYGNDFDRVDDDGQQERQALCFSESGATVPCLGRDTVYRCLAAGQLLDDVRSGQCHLLPEPRSSGRLLTLVAETVDRLLLNVGLFYIDRDFFGGDMNLCEQSDQSCISRRISLVAEALNSSGADRGPILGFLRLERESRRQVPLYAVARQLVRAEDSLYYPRSSTDAITAGVGPLTAVLEMRLFANNGGTENGGCALRRDSSLWCWGASSIGSNISLSGHGFWTAGETEAQFVVDRADENARQLGYRYAVSIVPWDISPNAVRVWTEIGIDFLLGADEQLLELEERGEQHAVTVPIRISVLAGPPDEFGKLRPLPFADVEIAAVEVLSVPVGVGLEFSPILLSPFQIGSTAVVESDVRVWFEDSYAGDSATIVLRFRPVIAEPDVSADQASLLVALQVGLLGGLSLELVSGSTANWSVTEQRSFKVRLQATDRFGNIFNPPAGSLLLDRAHPPEIRFDGIIGGDIITFSGGLSSRTLRFTRLENSDSSIILTASPDAEGPYADSGIRAMLSIAVAKTEVSRFQVSFDVTQQQLEADGVAEFRASVLSLDANGLPLIGPVDQTTGLTLQVTLTDTAGEEYVFESEVLVFADGEATSSFTVTLSGYDATQLAAELSGTTLPLEIVADGFGLIAVERLTSLTLAVNPLARQQQVFGQSATFTITVQSAGTKGGQPNPLNPIRLNADFDSAALSWQQLGGDEPLSFTDGTDGTAVVDVMVTPLRHCDSDPCQPESLEFFVSGAATEVTSNRASVEVTPAPVLASVTIAPIMQRQLPEAYQGAAVIVVERIVINSFGTDGGPFAPLGLGLRLVGTNLRIEGGGTTLSLSFDAAGRAEADISHLRLFVGEQGGDSTLNLDVIGAPTMPAMGTTIGVLAVQRIATLSVTFSAAELIGSRWGQMNNGDPLELSVDIEAEGTDGAAVSPDGLVLRISGTGITPARQDISLDFADGSTTQVDVEVNLAEQGVNGSLSAVLLFGNRAVANVAMPAIDLQVPRQINLVAVEIVAEVDWSNNRNIRIPIDRLNQPFTIEREIYLKGTKAPAERSTALGLPWSFPDRLTFEVLETTVSFVLPDNRDGGPQSVSFELPSQYLPVAGGNRTHIQLVSGTVKGQPVSTRRALFMETFTLILSNLTVSFDTSERFEQSEVGGPISVRLFINAIRSGDGGGRPYPGGGQQLQLRLQGSNIVGAGSVISVPLPASGEGIVEFEVNLAQQGIDGVIDSLEVVHTLRGSESAVIMTPQTAATLFAQEFLVSAKITAQPQVEQTEAGGALSFTVGVSEAVGSKGMPWNSENLRLGVSGDNVLATSSSLSIAGGTASALVTVTLANPNADGTAQFALLSDSEYLDALVLTQEPAEGVALIALPVLTEVRITVENQPPMYSTSAISIQLRVAADYLAKRSTTVLTVMVSGLDESPSWQITIPKDETSVLVEQSVQLGALRGQATLRFAAGGLPQGVTVVSNDEVVVSLVPSALNLSLSPADVQGLAPRGAATAEIRVEVTALDAENRAFGGLSGLLVQPVVTTATGGQPADVSVFASAAEETEPGVSGVYVSTLTVTLSGAPLISKATLQLEVAGVAGENLRPAAVAELSLAREVILGSLELSLANEVLTQSALGATVQTAATVEARDQFGEPFRPDGLQLRVVAIGGSEVQLITLAFDEQGQAQSVLMLTPPRGRDQDLRVEVIGVTDPAVSTNTVTLELIAVEALASLTVTVPASTQTQTMRDQAVDFELTVTAAGSKGTDPFQPIEILELQYVADRDDVMVEIEPLLTFNAGVATVTVSVTPVPGIDARVTFDNVGGAFRDVVIIPAELAVIAAEVLNTVTLTVQGDQSQIVRSGEEEILITVRLETEYLGNNMPAETMLQLRAVGTNGVEDSAVVEVVIPTGGSTTATLSLTLGAARVTLVSFEVENLPSGTNFDGGVVAVTLVPVPVSLTISATPQAIGDLELRGDAVAEFSVTVDVQGSDGQPFEDPVALTLDTMVTDVTGGNPGDLTVDIGEPVAAAAAGVYESTLMVTIPEAVNAASVEITVTDGGTRGLTDASITVRLGRRVGLDNLILSLAAGTLEQSAAGQPVQTTATVQAQDRDGAPVMPIGLQLRVVDTADESEVQVVDLEFDAMGQAQSMLTLTPPRGRNQSLRVEVIGVTDPAVTSNTVPLELTAAEVLSTVTLTVPASPLTQMMRDQAVSFELTVTAAGSRGTEPFQPMEVLELRYDAAPGVTVDYESPLTFNAGVAMVTVSVTPVPGIDAQVNFSVVGAPGEVDIIPAEVNVIAADVLSTVTLTVQGDQSRIVRSGQEEILITVLLETDYLGVNEPAQTSLRLRAVGTDGQALAEVDVVVPAGGSMTAELSLMLGTARQTTVSFAVVGLPGVSLVSPDEVQVKLVPVADSLTISVMPQVIGDLESLGVVTAEFRVQVEVQGSDGLPFGGLGGLVLNTTVTAVTDGEKGDLVFSSPQLMETTTGVHESTLRVTIADGQVSAASVEITVEGAGLAAVSATVQLGRQEPLASLVLLLADSQLRQAEAGESVQTMATVVARNRDTEAVMPVGLQLRVVDTADESEVLAAMDLVFDAQGEAQLVLTLTPPRGRDQSLRVEVIGVTDPAVTTNTVALELIAVEVVDSLTVAVPASPLPQTMPAEAVVFDVTVTAVGTKGSTLLEPTGLELQHVTDPDVVVNYDSALSFSAGVATVTVSVTPVPGTNTDVNFRVTGTADALDGVVTIPAEVNIIAADVLSTVTLTVQNGLMREVPSGQEPVTIEVQLTAEYLGENKPVETRLMLRAVGTNDVEVSGLADVVVIPDGGSAAVDLSLMLGTTARQTIVSFELVEPQLSGLSFVRPQVQVDLVPVPDSLAISVMPLTIDALEPRDAVTAEFQVTVEVEGSDGQPFGGLGGLALATTVTAVADGVADDLTFTSAMFEESEVGVYETTLSVTIAALRVSEASVEISVEGAGLTGIPVTVRLLRQMTMDMLTLELSDTVLEQSAAGASVQTTATVTALDQFDQPLSPTDLQLRVVDRDDGSVVTTSTLVFDAEGQAQSVLTLTPPQEGTNQNLRVELVRVTAADVSIAMAELQIEAAEALGRVILAVVGDSEQFVSTRSFSITLELSLERAGDRPLTAATVWMAQLNVQVVGGTPDEENFALSVYGDAPGSVVITGRIAENQDSATISLSVADGVPAVPVDIRPANTVKVNFVADLDVDNNAVFDVADAVQILRAANNALPANLSEDVRARLEAVLSSDNRDRRLDVDGNGMVEPIDVRVLLRYSAGLRGDSLMEGATDTAAIEQRAKSLIDSN